MKRYLLFCLEHYYPNGGMNDLVGSFDSIEDAKLALRFDLAHIYDTETHQIVNVWFRENGVWSQPIDFVPFMPGEITVEITDNSATGSDQAFDSAESLTDGELAKEIFFASQSVVDGDPLTTGWLDHLQDERGQREGNPPQ